MSGTVIVSLSTDKMFTHSLSLSLSPGLQVFDHHHSHSISVASLSLTHINMELAKNKILNINRFVFGLFCVKQCTTLEHHSFRSERENTGTDLCIRAVIMAVAHCIYSVFFFVVFGT